MLLYQEKSRGPSKTIRFRNTDIRTVFEIIQMIYERDYKKMNAFIVWRKRIDTELVLVEYVEGIGRTIRYLKDNRRFTRRSIK